MITLLIVGSCRPWLVIVPTTIVTPEVQDWIQDRAFEKLSDWLFDNKEQIVKGVRADIETQVFPDLDSELHDIDYVYHLIGEIQWLADYC